VDNLKYASPVYNGAMWLWVLFFSGAVDNGGCGGDMLHESVLSSW